MAHSVLSDRHFHDEAAALAFVEARIWANGVTCPHCGNADESRIGKLTGKSTRMGVRKCYACRKPFTVKVGTIFESSHAPLHLWLQAIYLMSSSKKGISTQQLKRTLGVAMKTAWFMGHRIREAMGDYPGLDRSRKRSYGWWRQAGALSVLSICFWSINDVGEVLAHVDSQRVPSPTKACVMGLPEKICKFNFDKQPKVASISLDIGDLSVAEFDSETPRVQAAPLFIGGSDRDATMDYLGVLKTRCVRKFNANVPTDTNCHNQGRRSTSVPYLEVMDCAVAPRTTAVLSQPAISPVFRYRSAQVEQLRPFPLTNDRQLNSDSSLGASLSSFGQPLGDLARVPSFAPKVAGGTPESESENGYRETAERNDKVVISVDPIETPDERVKQKGYVILQGLAGFGGLFAFLWAVTRKKRKLVDEVSKEEPDKP